MRLTGLLVMGVFLLAGCAQPNTAQPTPEVKEKAKASAPKPRHDEAKFRSWLKELRTEAKTRGISEKTLDDALGDITHLDRVIELDRKQPESRLTLEEYLAKVVSDQRINRGRELLAENRALLDEISAKYGVPPEIIVALWGIETSYGNNTGSFSVPEALATLAFDGRRSAYFRGELLSALKIIEEGHIDATSMEGSWAGAMGQCQFMPSSFMNFAVDYDGDGKRDIWNTQADIFASIANYLSRSGWNNDSENNFNVLLKWNRSRYFATAVMQIADGIKS